MTTATRTQLTLFVQQQQQAAALEAVRRLLDPIQHGLIAAHVTLCREDELEGLTPALIQQRLTSPPAMNPLTLHFGAAERFGDGHGVLLPCVAGAEAFHALRQRVLGNTAPRHQPPHITLAHPRNPRAPGNDLANAACLAAGLRITFTSICRIEQMGSGAWQLLDRFPLL